MLRILFFKISLNKIKIFQIKVLVLSQKFECIFFSVDKLFGQSVANQMFKLFLNT